MASSDSDATNDLKSTRLLQAKQLAEAAREQCKELRRKEQMAQGYQHRRLAKGDSSLTEHEKYKRRLKKNQDSAAAARFAKGVYIDSLERFVEMAEGEQSMLSLEAAHTRSHRDALAKRVLQLQERLAVLRAEQGQTTCEEEDSESWAVENCASTALLLQRTATLLNLTDLHSSQVEFAQNLMGVQAAPAV